MTETVFKAAVVQASPVFLDPGATVEKACGLIEEAAREGARLVVFPEVFVSGYPDWAWVLPPGPQKALLTEMNALLIEQAVTIPGPVTDRLCSAAAKAGVHLGIGLHERNSEGSGSSVYNTLLFVDDEGGILGRHRKLVPTGAERLVWSRGDGSTLGSHATKLGRLGGLVCWENFMPLARQALYEAGVQLHLAPTWDSSEGWLVSMRHIAKEGGMFVFSACMALRPEEIPDRFEFKRHYPEGKDWINRGNSCIVDPMGRIIAGPLCEEQGILYAEIDLKRIAEWKWLFDAAGHYARPDVFRSD